MRRNLLLAVGGVFTVFGLLFFLQGTGLVHGSPMTGVSFWLYAGLVIAIVGIALVTVGIRTARR